MGAAAPTSPAAEDRPSAVVAGERPAAAAGDARRGTFTVDSGPAGAAAGVPPPRLAPGAARVVVVLAGVVVDGVGPGPAWATALATSSRPRQVGLLPPHESASTEASSRSTAPWAVVKPRAMSAASAPETWGVAMEVPAMYA